MTNNMDVNIEKLWILKKYALFGVQWYNLNYFYKFIVEILEINFIN